MKEILEILNSEIKEIHYTNQNMRTYIDSCNKEPEKLAAYTENITVHLENVSNITLNIDSVIPQ